MSCKKKSKKSDLYDVNKKMMEAKVYGQEIYYDVNVKESPEKKAQELGVIHWT